MESCCGSCCEDDNTQEILMKNNNICIGLSADDNLDLQGDTTATIMLPKYKKKSEKSNSAKAKKIRKSSRKNEIFEQDLGSKSESIQTNQVTLIEENNDLDVKSISMKDNEDSDKKKSSQNIIINEENEPKCSYNHLDTKLERNRREIEKKRMQDLIKEFARDAVFGINVEEIDSKDGTRRKATFRMDKQLARFQLISEIDSSDSCKFKDVEMANIAVLYRSNQILEKHPNFPIKSSEISNTLAIGISGSPAAHIFLYFQDQKQHDKFYTCLKILRLAIDIFKKHESRSTN